MPTGVSDRIIRRDERSKNGFVRTGESKFDLRWTNLCGKMVPPIMVPTIIYHFAKPTGGLTIYSRGSDYVEYAIYNTIYDCIMQVNPIWHSIRVPENSESNRVNTESNDDKSGIHW